MSRVYLMRHGQAGPRHDYDRLSVLGEQQSRALGRYLVSLKVEFVAAYVGRLDRQRRTAQAVQAEYQSAGLPFPELVEEPLWDEFDLGHVYQELSDPLGQDDPRFRQEFAGMMAAIESGDSAVHRSHNYCDIAIVRAWTAGRYSYSGESWQAFRERVSLPKQRLARFTSGENVAVFTSATPIGVWMGEALGLRDREIWRLAGATYNSGLSTVRVADDELRLFTFNALPHLPDTALWSFR
ncbi:MAG: histidine phosphatase family protein [Acidobacteria bacterium]|nr:histidine phosphatase family protein [Acidobacteriota bacterium]